MKKANSRKIFIHLPAYREPELVPTIKSALENATHPNRLVFGICRQFNPKDGFDNVDEFNLGNYDDFFDYNDLGLIQIEDCSSLSP